MQRTFRPEIDEADTEFDGDVFDGDPGARPLRRARPFRRTRIVAQMTCAVAVIAGISILAREAMVAPDRPWTDPVREGFASPGLAPVRTAVPVASVGPLFRLDDPGAVEPGRAEPPRWNPATGLREDAVTQGQFDSIEAPFLRVTIAEADAMADPSPSLFVTLARRAADGPGLSVTRTGERGQVDTKFGPFETVEATLSGSGARHCTGFMNLAGPLRLDGWLCGVLGQAPEPRAVVCALDRLVLAGSAAPTLETAFGEAESRRDGGCLAPADARAPSPAAAGSTGSTGSIPAPVAEPRRRTRKNTAQLRQNAQARP